MEFDFDKFVKDIDVRKEEETRRRSVNEEIAELDKQRRLRAERYHERWQNRIEWRRDQ